MSIITVKNLVDCDLFGEIARTNLIRDLSEEEINLHGGMCAASDAENAQGCSDVIINFPQKFDSIEIIRKHK